MKVEVVEYLVERGIRVRRPGEVLEVSEEDGERLIERGVAKPVKPKEEEEEA